MVVGDCSDKIIYPESTNQIPYFITNLNTPVELNVSSTNQVSCPITSVTLVNIPNGDNLKIESPLKNDILKLQVKD